ncbi:MAG: MFS transporter [Asticcacaulis sp.]
MMPSITNRNVTKYAAIAAFGGFVFGLDAANLSGALRFVSSQFELNSLQVGTLVSCAIVGVIIALFFTGALCEKFGRKKILLAIALTYSLSTLLCAFAVSYEMLVIGRFIGGIAFASITVSAMYIGEIAPADKRGRFVSISQLLITLGSLTAFVVNYFFVKSMDQIAWLNNENVWRFMLGFAFIANIVWVSTLMTIPESPRWLLKKHKDAQARLVFDKITPENKIEELIADVQLSNSEDAKNNPMAQLKTLFSRPMNYIVAVAVVYAIVQGATGMNAVLFFAPTVFEQIGMSVQDTFLQTVLLGAVAVVFTFVAIAFVEKWGRRFLTLGGLLLIVLAHSSIYYGFHTARYTIDQNAIEKIQVQKIEVSQLEPFVGKKYTTDVALKKDLAQVYSKHDLPLVSGPIIKATIHINAAFVLFGIFAFLAAFNLSVGPIMWVIFSEIFPNNVRSVALPFAALVQSISSYVIQQFFPWQLENMGAANTFLNYGIVALIGLVIMFFILPETKGKTIEELEAQLVKK